MFFLLVIIFLCLSCTKSANILGIFPTPAISHQCVFQAIWRELSLRGHNVTIVTPDPLNDPSLTNLTEISVKDAYNIWNHTKLENLMSKEGNPFMNLHKTFTFVDNIQKLEMNNSQLQKLINNPNQKFDLILIEFFYTLLHSLTRKFQAPIIGISSFGVHVHQNDRVGNPNHHVLYPDMFLSSSTTQLSFWNRVRHVLFGIWSLYYYHCGIVPNDNKQAEKFFGERNADLGNLEKNFSMLYLSHNKLLYPRRPNVPLVVEISQTHIKPSQSLPNELQQIMDEAEEGVVYLSLGSNVKSVNLEDNLRQIITQALSELPYKVIWKWEADDLPDKPPNVITRKWLPQQDLLAHPNIRVFVTQGGLQSTEEAIDRMVPMVGLPFVLDQALNMQRMFELGVGIVLDPFNVTKEALRRSIVKVAQNSNYKTQILKIRNLVYDKPLKSIEEVVWWTEYVIRHKGARHLRSPNADISWFNYLMLDVFIVIAAFLVITYISLSYIFRLK